VRRALTALLLVAFSAPQIVLAQGFRFSHPELKARKLPVAEYQAVGRTHDSECQARALELATRRYPAPAQPPLVATADDDRRDRERGELLEREYIQCMEGKGWERVGK
jgi:hypothetical protein